MRPPGNNTRPIIFGFILVIAITLTLPHFAFGAARSFGGFRRFGAPVIQRQPSFLHDLETSGRFPRKDFFPFHGYGFGGGVAVSDQPVVIIHQFQPAPITEPATNRIYVQPRWVDGGYGVQVLQPGYWADPRQAGGR